MCQAEVGVSRERRVVEHHELTANGDFADEVVGREVKSREACHGADFVRDLAGEMVSGEIQNA